MSDCDAVVREIDKIFPGGYQKKSTENRELKRLIGSLLDREKTTKAIERAKRIEKTAYGVYRTSSRTHQPRHKSSRAG